MGERTSRLQRSGARAPQCLVKAWHNQNATLFCLAHGRSTLSMRNAMQVGCERAGGALVVMVEVLRHTVHCGATSIWKHTNGTILHSPRSATGEALHVCAQRCGVVVIVLVVGWWE